MLQIVTLTYKAPHLIKDLNDSLNRHCKKHDYEWIIRDNSGDETIEDPKVRVIKAGNKGNFASMHNDILPEITKGKYILLLNNDMIALNDFITPMIKLMEKNEDIGIVGGNLTYPNGMLQHGGVVFANDKTPLNVSVHTMPKLGLYPKLHERTRIYKAVTGACLMIRTDLFKALRFDDKFEWCFDDVDLCLRAHHEFRKNIVYCADARMTHIENYSVAKNPTNLKPSLMPSFEYFKSKFRHLVCGDVDLYKMNYGLLQ